MGGKRAQADQTAKGVKGVKAASRADDVAPAQAEGAAAVEAGVASRPAEQPSAAGSRAPKAPPASNEHVRKSMQGNKRANTKPELLVRQRLREAGLSGYRLQWKVPGHPDIAWPGKKVCIEVRGCFWHRCPHCKPSLPKSHVEYWTVKFDRNVERDAETVQRLQELGWKVHVIWECQLKKGAIDQIFAELLPVLAEELGKPLRTASSAADSAPDERSAESDGQPAAPDECPIESDGQPAAPDVRPAAPGVPAFAAPSTPKPEEAI